MEKKLLIRGFVVLLMLVAGVLAVKIYLAKSYKPIPYKDTDLLRVLETRASSHAGGDGVVFDVFVKTDSGIKAEEIQIVDKQKNSVVSHSKVGSLGFSNSRCERQDIDFSGWTKYIAGDQPLPKDIEDFFSSPLPPDKYTINVTYKDGTGNRYLTGKQSEGICDVMME